MKGNRVIRIVVDIAMAVVLVAIMTTALVQEMPHEYLGVTMFALIIAHIVLNRTWLAATIRGKLGVPHVPNLILMLALVVCFVGMVASSLALSKYAFGFLPSLPGASWARRMHMLFSYWMFVLTFAHMGLHIRVPRRMETWKLWTLRVLAAVGTCYGVYAFVRLGLFGYLTGQVQFAMADFETPLAITFLRYTGVGMLVAVVFHGVQVAMTNALRRRRARGKQIRQGNGQGGDAA